LAGADAVLVPEPKLVVESMEVKADAK